MNKVLIFICSCILLGCSKNYEPLSDKTLAVEKPLVPIENAYKILIQEKIQDEIDKLKLQKEYPDFKYSIDTTNNKLELTALDAIADITLLDNVISDNIPTQDVRTIITYQSKKQDTIIANIHRSKITIEGEEITATKVSLKKYKE